MFQDTAAEQETIPNDWEKSSEESAAKCRRACKTAGLISTHQANKEPRRYPSR